MFISAGHLAVKSDQDRSDFLLDEDQLGGKLVLCDGIGEFPDSGKVAALVCKLLIEKNCNSVDDVLYDQELIEAKESGLTGGTTVLFCSAKKSKLHIEYLGNGGIVHLSGDFYQNSFNGIPYQYSSIMNPHVSDDGALLRHISHHSGKTEMASTKIDLNVNSVSGDILLMYSDGVNSQENNVLLKDENGRYWRNESEAVLTILNHLHAFIVENSSLVKEQFQEQLVGFNRLILKELKVLNLLEDDAALGILISDDVLNFYRKTFAND